MKLWNEISYNKGRKDERQLQDIALNAELSRLKKEAQKLESEKAELIKQIENLTIKSSDDIYQLVIKASYEMIHIAKQGADELNKHIKIHTNEIQAMQKARKIYEESYSKMQAVETVFNQFTQIKLQAANSAGQRAKEIIEKVDKKVDKDISQIEKKINKELKKNEV